MSQHKRWSTKEDEILIQNYGTHSYDGIASMLDGRTSNAVSYRVFSLGLAKGKRLSKAEEQFIINSYKTLGRRQLAEKLNRPIPCIDYYLRKHRLRYVRPVSYNTGFFDTLTLKSCALGGLIASDGTVNLKDNSVSICLRDYDRRLLEEWAYWISLDSSLGEYIPKGQKPVVTLSVYHATQWRDQLRKRFNIKPNKSLTLEPPNLDKDLHKKAFMVGFIDGDGYIGQVRGRLCLTVVGTEKICYWFRDLHRKWYDLSDKYSYVGRVKNKTFRYSITGLKAEKILADLNTIKVPKLERKWSKVNGSSRTNSSVAAAAGAGRGTTSVGRIPTPKTRNINSSESNS